MYFKTFLSSQESVSNHDAIYNIVIIIPHHEEVHKMQKCYDNYYSAHQKQFRMKVV